MKTICSLPDLRFFIRNLRNSGKTLSFVPTMGALHDGHLALVRQGLARADICIPYIFLNPKQFSAHEDLANYPKTLESDLKKLRKAGASAVYLPTAQDVYPDDFVTKVTLGGIALPLEGEFRPVMFEGVATVVCKMLLRCLPDIALFGEKDYQQLMVIKQMVRDLDIPVEIVDVPTVRDENGLALSSRNAYLTPAQYEVAVRLNKILIAMAGEVREGRAYAAVESDARESLLSAGFEKVDYVSVRDAATLLPPLPKARNLRILAAAHIGRARLIDNIAV